MPANPNAVEPVKPRRRWFQFRLRTLLIVVTVLGVACWIASSIRDRQARERVKQIERDLGIKGIDDE